MAELIWLFFRGKPFTSRFQRVLGLFRRATPSHSQLRRINASLSVTSMAMACLTSPFCPAATGKAV